jgi:ubiquinone/menaquinone biosynthesis C-methylase UbiE
MNTSESLGRRSFAAWYPTLMGLIDRRGQAALRREQLAAARGRVLEIGAGSGLSVPHYPPGIDELVLVEPNPAFHRALRVAAGRLPFPVSVIDADAHELPFPDSSFDTVTASLVFCSVDDPARMLAEVHRVLRPGGRFLFHEHVRGGRFRAVVQDLLTPLQRRLADGCRPNRDFGASLAASALRVVAIDHRRMPTPIPTLVPLVVGTAERRPVGRPGRAAGSAAHPAVAGPSR